MAAYHDPLDPAISADHTHEAAYGTEDICPKSPEGHEPDWNSLTTDYDGEDTYLDVACRYCGRSGCVGTLETLLSRICW